MNGWYISRRSEIYETSASNSSASKRLSEYRDPYFRDECRVIHSFGFRRLQDKMQIFGSNQGDFHRTRMSHSLEVASVSRSIVAYLKHNKKLCENILPDDYLITAIGLLHDTGHPAFGHQGEYALHYKMREHGGFEGNAQTLRNLTKMETFTEKHGSDLTRRTLLGILKYPISFKETKYKADDKKHLRNRDVNLDDWKPPKCFYDCDQKIIDWLLDKFSETDRLFLYDCEKHKDKDKCFFEAKNKTLDCSIMDIADDITNAVHDIEDAVYLKLLRYDDAENYVCESKKDYPPHWNEIHGFFDNDTYKRKEAIGSLIHNIICSIEVQKHDECDDDLLKYTVKLGEDYEELVKILQKMVYKKVILSPEVASITNGGGMVVMQVFDAIKSSPKTLLPKPWWEDKYNKAEGKKDDEMRVICDYVASMTDNYAWRMRNRLYGNEFGSIFERL